jgi:hypothetical protein
MMAKPLLPNLTLHLGRAGVFAAVAAVSNLACTINLPPAPTPERIPPPIGGSEPVAEGEGRLVVDVVEGPTRISRGHVRSEPLDDGRVSLFFDDSEVLCEASPCVVDLPHGNVLLQFPVVGRPRTEGELVYIGSQPSVYRRSLSRAEGSGSLYQLGIIGASLGGMSAMVGAVFLPLGLVDDSKGMTITGGITLGVGAALLTAGILAIRADAPTWRPGSSVHYPAP